MIRKLVKLLMPRKLFRAVEPYGHLAESVLWQIVEGFPARGLKVIGVTGTDGKTTTSTMIYTMMNEAGLKTGLMTTIGYGLPGDWHDNMVHMTTMPTRVMLKRIKKLKAAGAEWLVLETTSHALAQHRVWGIKYSVAVMTNVTHEHLDYHGTFERYTAAKVRLFKLVGGWSGGLRTGIVNADDAAAGVFAAQVPKAIRYGLRGGDLRASHVKLAADGSDFEVELGGVKTHLRVNLPGEFNVSNALATAAVGLTVGLKPAQIKHGLVSLEGVAGRLITVNEGQNFAVIVDFAHTPGSYEKILPQIKALTKGRLIVMFGSAGRRDETKRAVQGRLAGQYADVVVVTEEDDRDVDGIAIMNQIAAGAEESGKKRDRDLYLVHDRSNAIRHTVGLAEVGDTVLLLGKGHETTIERADGEHPWNEVVEARAALKELKAK